MLLMLLVIAPANSMFEYELDGIKESKVVDLCKINSYCLVHLKEKLLN